MAHSSQLAIVWHTGVPPALYWRISDVPVPIRHCETRHRPYGRRRYSVWAIAFNALGLDLLPDLSFPVNAIITIYPNADAETIESAVTAKVEDAISTVNDLKRVSSMSYENISVVLAEFNWGTDLVETTQEIAAAIETLRYALPSAAQKPIVMQFDPSQIPIALIGLSSDTLGLEELTRMTEEEIIPVVERTPGVATTSISGGVGEAVTVTYDPDKLEEIGMSDVLLAQMLAAQNVFVPIGPVFDDGKRFMGKVGMEITSIDELKRLVVGVSEPEETGAGPSSACRSRVRCISTT